MHTEKKLFICGLVFICFSCKNKSDNITREYYSTGVIKTEMIPVKDSVNQFTYIDFYPTGVIKGIQNLKNNTAFGEALLFYKNGQVEKKINFDTNGVANGMAYWFYSNGILQSTRNYKDDKQVGLGLDYWNKLYGSIQTEVLFNDSGNGIYKENYDSTGVRISTEGKKPAYWIGD